MLKEKIDLLKEEVEGYEREIAYYKEYIAQDKAKIRKLERLEKQYNEIIEGTVLNELEDEEEPTE